MWSCLQGKTFLVAKRVQFPSGDAHSWAFSVYFGPWALLVGFTSHFVALVTQTAPAAADLQCQQALGPSVLPFGDGFFSPWPQCLAGSTRHPRSSRSGRKTRPQGECPGSCADAWINYSFCSKLFLLPNGFWAPRTLHKSGRVASRWLVQDLSVHLGRHKWGWESKPGGVGTTANPRFCPLPTLLSLFSFPLCDTEVVAA